MINEKGYWMPDGITADVALLARNIDNKVIVLLIQRADSANTYPGMLALPGGHLDVADKDIKDCAVRELLEETNLTVQKEDLFIIDVFAGPDRDPRGYYVDTAYYSWIGLNDIKTAQAGDDAQNIVLLPLDDIEETELAFDHKIILQTLKRKLGL